jgi:hypothetical protein
MKNEDTSPDRHSLQLKSGIANTWIRKVSPPFEGGVAGPLFNYDTKADTGRGG